MRTAGSDDGRAATSSGPGAPPAGRHDGGGRPRSTPPPPPLPSTSTRAVPRTVAARRAAAAPPDARQRADFDALWFTYARELQLGTQLAQGVAGEVYKVRGRTGGHGVEIGGVQRLTLGDTHNQWRCR